MPVAVSQSELSWSWVHKFRYQFKRRIYDLRSELGPVGADVEESISGRCIDHLVAGGLVGAGDVNDGDLKAMSVAGRHICLSQICLISRGSEYERGKDRYDQFWRSCITLSGSFPYYVYVDCGGWDDFTIVGGQMLTDRVNVELISIHCRKPA